MCDENLQPPDCHLARIDYTEERATWHNPLTFVTAFLCLLKCCRCATPNWMLDVFFLFTFPQNVSQSSSLLCLLVRAISLWQLGPLGKCVLFSFHTGEEQACLCSGWCPRHRLAEQHMQQIISFSFPVVLCRTFNCSSSVQKSSCGQNFTLDWNSWKSQICGLIP